MILFRHPRVRSILRESRTPILISAAATLARSLLALLVPWYFGTTVQVIFDEAPRSEVIRQVTFLLCTAAITAFCQYWMRWLYIGVSRHFEYRLRNDLFDHLNSLSFSFFNRSKTGDIMSRLTADIEAVRMGIGPGVMHLLQTGVMALGAVIFMFAVSWKLTLLAMIPMALMLLICKWLMPKMHDASEVVQTQIGRLSALAQESFSGARVVQAFARENYEIGRFQKESEKYIRDSMRLAAVRAHFHVVIEVMTGLVIVALVWFGGRRVISGELSLGFFAAFHGYFMMLIWPMIAIGWTLSLFQRADVALKRLDEVFNVQPEIQSGTYAPKELKGTWEFRNLSFTYPTGPEVLHQVSFRLEAGRSLALVGPTGCGKSTVVQLLGRLFDPPPGTVFLDGVDVREWDLCALRSSLAMVPQETFLFSDTISANISCSDPDVPFSRIEAASEAAEVKESILGFPHGFDEVIGERGVTLSGGQKQRVAIARALCRPAATLILDDCLSAVDTSTEEKILENLSRLTTQQTVIVTAHRLSSVMSCDEILVLKEGRVIERGSHADLMQFGGWYAETYRQQMIGRELEAA